MSGYKTDNKLGDTSHNADQISSIDTSPAATLESMSIPLQRNRFLTEVYYNCQTDLCAYIRKTFGGGPPDPEDVVQTAFCKFAALEDPYAIRNPHAFLLTTARNIIFDHHKKAKTRNNHLRQVAEDRAAEFRLFDDLTPERVILGKEECDILRRALKNMSKKRRELLLLHRVHGMSYVDLAKRTGLSQTTVKYHVAMAFSECLSAMDDAGIGPGNED
ncbi:RNA polymerase sigma factor [Paremcibacter congregatus]|uniref:RNA polymerase subunit sigma-70 n=1 Tax=Paremcibacter congregatus TaxID=2043170 RepID=A0A2G4YMQ3_9PROT|nr:RNA polymerase sigma factor [Paremcibacter congregatus]PHZ83573.1 hypothetical protein CRD36_16540 [Paremcibacter congregatus]QDE28341.1 RNA polymerase sigma factor [Paremcibacter congregatus]